MIALDIWRTEKRLLLCKLCYRAPSERAPFGHNFLQTHNECAFSLR